MGINEEEKVVNLNHDNNSIFLASLEKKEK